MVVVDGHTYKDASQAPDLGSLVAVEVLGGIRKYKGLAKDASKLPKYEDLLTGSTFMASDSDLFMEYEMTTQTWYTK